MKKDLTITCGSVEAVLPLTGQSIFPKLEINLEMVELKELLSQIEVGTLISLVGVDMVLNNIGFEDIKNYLQDNGEL